MYQSVSGVLRQIISNLPRIVRSRRILHDLMSQLSSMQLFKASAIRSYKSVQRRGVYKLSLKKEARGPWEQVGIGKRNAPAKSKILTGLLVDNNMLSPFSQI